MILGVPLLPLNSTALLDTQVSPTFGAHVVGLQVSRPSLALNSTALSSTHGRPALTSSKLHRAPRQKNCTMSLRMQTQA